MRTKLGKQGSEADLRRKWVQLAFEAFPQSGKCLQLAFEVFPQSGKWVQIAFEAFPQSGKRYQLALEVFPQVGKWIQLAVEVFPRFGKCLQLAFEVFPQRGGTQILIRRNDKKLPEMSSTFYHDKFPLETCISNATSHFITKWRKKSIES
ncbi:MAG: hypothetical protein K2J68_04580 [Treponemataceae bacterium]|nr:hypothetical protein [Treponemataceae bacterium]